MGFSPRYIHSHLRTKPEGQAAPTSTSHCTRLSLPGTKDPTVIARAITW